MFAADLPNYQAAWLAWKRKHDANRFASPQMLGGFEINPMFGFVGLAFGGIEFKDHPFKLVSGRFAVNTASLRTPDPPLEWENSSLTLVTRDAARYRTYFPGLKLIAPKEK